MCSISRNVGGIDGGMRDERMFKLLLIVLVVISFFYFENAKVFVNSQPISEFSVSPSGRLPSRLFNPAGSLETGIPAEMKARANKLVTAWCLAVLLEA